MKKLSLTLAAVTIAVFLHAQSISFVNNKEVKLKKEFITINLPTPPDTSQSISTLLFKVNGLAKSQKVTITFRDYEEGTAKLKSDYTYQNHLLDNSIFINSATTPIFAINIKTTTWKQTNAILCINVTSNNPKQINDTYKVIFNFNTDVSTPRLASDTAKKFVPDTSKWYLRIVTGGNFDFFNGPSIKDFAGDISLFLPGVFKIGNWHIGLELGLNNYHYFDSDSSHTLTDGAAYFLRNTDYYSPTDSSRIIRTSQNVNRKYDYNVWGVHANILVPLIVNDFAQLYNEIHFEELATTETYTPTLASTTNDTITYAVYKNLYNSGILAKVNGVIPIPGAHPPAFYPYKQHTYYDVYAGEGFFADFNLKNVARFCYSITAGPAFIELAEPNFDPNPVQRDVIGPSGHTQETKLYILNKFQIVTTVAPVDIALGGEYRTVAGNIHYFTTYVGGTIRFDQLKRK